MINEKDLNKLFRFFEEENILLVDKDLIGSVELPLIDFEYILDRIIDEDALN